MNIKCNSFEEFRNNIESYNKSIVMFGSGVIGRITAVNILSELRLLDRIDCYVDNDQRRWGNTVDIRGRDILIKSPEYLYECTNNTVILINISRYSSVLQLLEAMDCTRKMDCYFMGMMCIHNLCSAVSDGEPTITDAPLIPKKLHYMWLGGNSIPNNLKRCIDSWRKFCPEYEIVEWNENNYDIGKHPYMTQAYKEKAYGFIPDYARLDILYNEGGFYLDTDVELKRSIDDLCYQEAFCGVEKWQVVNFGGLSGAIKGHPMIKKFLDARKDVFFLDPEGNQNRNTCGYYDTQVIIDEGYKINGKTQYIKGMNIYAYDYFHPYDYMSGIVNETEHLHSIHWFNGGWLDEIMKKANEDARVEYEALYQKALGKNELVISKRSLS